MISLNDIQALIPECCEADALGITALNDNERMCLSDFLPNFKSVIVMAHHVRHSLEWTWFQFAASRDGCIPPADLHLEGEAQKVMNLLERSGRKSILIPYPAKCGVRFKNLADKTGLGKMGDNFLFLHREWGPWTHLRVILTDAVITDCLKACDAVCIHCGACAAACPANAIQEKELLGTVCGSHQHSIGKSIHAYDYQCEVCLRICPVGSAPEPVTVT